MPPDPTVPKYLTRHETSSEKLWWGNDWAPRNMNVPRVYLTFVTEKKLLICIAQYQKDGKQRFGSPTGLENDLEWVNKQTGLWMKMLVGELINNSALNCFEYFIQLGLSECPQPPAFCFSKNEHAKNSISSRFSKPSNPIAVIRATGCWRQMWF